jgi:hypothetical protein
MKKTCIALFFLLFVSTTIVQAQDTRFYGSSSGEMIFSFAAIDYEGNDQGSILRWAPVFNIQGLVNLDFANTFGLFTGLGIRNVGFIHDVPNTSIRMKYRTYNLGIPVGLKIGKLDFMFLFAGYEIEFPFHYKEKKFENEVKDKFGVWFSDRVEPVQHSFLAGIQFPLGMTIKFKYYLTNFHNMDFIAYDNDTGESTKPYENLKANVIYLSIAWNMFTPPKAYYKKAFNKKTMR